ncbi:MFS transporter [Amycolatopsis sp. WQ 127309]|uniref:MFS transporter n=1 Tax=Amycolatopsis sp. WQ 127309 TaxID=2932773 RepID=UPI001FF4FA6F|nr:MFS transporter [Amycolatopsis sp. WQ 127309]UOZ02731.1 MFS transporter [Amycolatopsis sp. WQ 127309]
MTAREEPTAPAPEAAGPAEIPVLLSRNRDFRLLWVSQLASVLGSRMSYVGYPLLVLSLTGSPVLAGLVATARGAPQWLLGLPAGFFADRWDRRRLMLTCDLVRFVALASIVGGLATGWLTYPHIIVVALVEGSATVLFSPAEVGALRHVVPASQLRSATARNESREYGAMLAGPPIGGTLFSIAALLPFLGDALSYLVSYVTVSMIKTRFRSAPVPDTKALSLVSGVRDGLRWLFRQPFLRGSALMVAATNLVGNGMPTLLVVIGHESGTPAAVVGTVLTVAAVGGLLGSFAATWAAERIPASWIVIGFPWVWAALLPILLVAGNIVVMGVVFGLMLAAAPLWNSVLSTYRIVLVPDELLGRVDSACRFISQSATPLSPLLAGVLLQFYGSTTTVLVMLGWLVLVALVGTVVPALRHPPVLPGDEKQPSDPVVA